MSEGISVFLNVTLFVGGFWLILLFAGIADRHRDGTSQRSEERRVA
jgi:hypothetical protein